MLYRLKELYLNVSSSPSSSNTYFPCHNICSAYSKLILLQQLQQTKRTCLGQDCKGRSSLLSVAFSRSSCIRNDVRDTSQNYCPLLYSAKTEPILTTAVNGKCTCAVGGILALWLLHSPLDQVGQGPVCQKVFAQRKVSNPMVTELFYAHIFNIN